MLNSNLAKYGTRQENFWSGEFGDNYIDRNQGEEIISGNISLFSKVFNSTRKVQSVLELGPNIGLNLMAIHALLPSAKITGVEINKKACDILSRLDYVEAINCSLLDVVIDYTYDFVYTKGVLIHQSPSVLPQIYDLLYNKSNRYIFICEYYSPSPVEVSYRGHDSVLFKRDFAGEILDKYPDVRLINYGFVYHRDGNFPQDDLNWFLLEKE